ncbi:MAG TPA: hypothetical protein VK386_02155 [Acidimicrobiales bacterium]|nr:hypothetical protein [Acidimicrobiales bacterium]
MGLRSSLVVGDAGCCVRGATRIRAARAPSTGHLSAVLAGTLLEVLLASRVLLPASAVAGLCRYFR